MPPKPAPPTIASLPRINPTDLRSLILSNPTNPPAIIDVRDADHIGGHIAASTHVPSSTLDWRASELARELRGKEVVVFHCMLSQQRGPGAAVRYLRERGRLGFEAEGDGGEVEGEEQGEGKRLARMQKVLVLEGGFQAWQEKYGTDPRLTEAYEKDLWESLD